MTQLFFIMIGLLNGKLLQDTMVYSHDTTVELSPLPDFDRRQSDANHRHDSWTLLLLSLSSNEKCIIHVAF